MALKRFFYFFIPAMLVVYFLRQDSRAWLFFLVSTVGFGLLTYMIVGGTRANIIIAFAIPVYRHYSRLDLAWDAGGGGRDGDCGDVLAGA